jgi:hypothetical protein
MGPIWTWPGAHTWKEPCDTHTLTLTAYRLRRVAKLRGPGNNRRAWPNQLHMNPKNVGKRNPLKDHPHQGPRRAQEESFRASAKERLGERLNINPSPFSPRLGNTPLHSSALSLPMIRHTDLGIMVPPIEGPEICW